MSKQKLTVIIVGGAVIVVVVVKIFLSLYAGQMDPSRMRVKGDLKARVQIVEFIDFQCPACADGAIKLRKIYALHPKDIRIEMKYFPLMAIHRHTMIASTFAECAGRQGKFWPMHDLIVERQAQWKDLISAEGMFMQFAREAGVEQGALRRCLASPDVEETVMRDRDLGRSLGVRSTPTYFINHKMVVGGKSLTDELNQYFPSQ
ncbi:MAG TPA: DsbA family protein [Candidatus Omnitrophota bacterium]|nr:DsbA family protein [Candidatus Omnitrophota bacterium]